jgi:hypothetical protein
MARRDPRESERVRERERERESELKSLAEIQQTMETPVSRKPAIILSRPGLNEPLILALESSF